MDDESLIDVLKTTKETAADVAKQLEVADSTNKMIDLAREEYRPGKNNPTPTQCFQRIINLILSDTAVMF